MGKEINAKSQAVLITGAGGGMGKAAVLKFLAKGYRVFASDKNEIAKDEFFAASNLTESEKSDFKQRLCFIVCDVSDNRSVLNCLDQVKKQTDELFAVIHFAGIYMLDSLIEIPPEKFEKAFKINVFGAFLINRAFAPLLKENGRILMITSELAPLAPLPFTGLYAVTKGALDKYAHSLKMELQLKGIYVSVLRAGAVSTGMLGVSTAALDEFCKNTEYYAVGAERFKKIVNAVEAKSISPEKLAEKTVKIITAKKPKFAYSINRNFLLRLYGIAPARVRFFAVKKILKQK